LKQSFGEHLIGYVPQGHWKTITFAAALVKLHVPLTGPDAYA
jgi:hypothetical protein